jgi:hypothetical protein
MCYRYFHLTLDQNESPVGFAVLFDQHVLGPVRSTAGQIGKELDYFGVESGKQRGMSEQLKIT